MHKCDSRIDEIFNPQTESVLQVNSTLAPTNWEAVDR